MCERMTAMELREELASISRRTFQRGLVRGSGGNVSARLGSGTMLITPSGVTLGDVTPYNIVEVDLVSDEWLAQEQYIPSKEFRFHKVIYEALPDVHGIVHCHPPHATAFAVRKMDIPYVTDAAFKQPAMPHISYSPSGSEALVHKVEQAARGNEGIRVLMLDEHGIVAVGESLMQALIFADLAEEMAEIAFLSKLIAQ